MCEVVSGYVPTLCLDSGIISPIRLHWVKGVRVFRCDLPPALLAEWLGSFMCHCSNTGVEQTLNKSWHTKLTLGKKFSCCSCWDSHSQPFNHKSGALTNKLPWLPTFKDRCCEINQYYYSQKQSMSYKGPDTLCKSSIIIGISSMISTHMNYSS